VVCSCEYDYEVLGSIKDEGFVDLLCTLDVKSSISGEDSYWY
jgi:hypothetical protein